MCVWTTMDTDGSSLRSACVTLYRSHFGDSRLVCKIKLQIIINESYCDPNLLCLVC